MRAGPRGGALLPGAAGGAGGGARAAGGLLRRAWPVVLCAFLGAFVVARQLAAARLTGAGGRGAGGGGSVGAPAGLHSSLAEAGAEAARKEAAAALKEAEAARREAAAAKAEAKAALMEAKKAVAAASRAQEGGVGKEGTEGGGTAAVSKKEGKMEVRVKEPVKETTPKEPKPSAAPSSAKRGAHWEHGETPLEDVEGADAECPGGRNRPYHLVITAQGTTYQQWQTRLMYYHYLKQKEADVCGNMGGVTRLVALDEGKRAEDLEDEVPSFFVDAIPKQVLERYKGYGVVNRPHSLKQLFNSPEGLERITEDYIFIAETDHIFTLPIPNMATPTRPRAFHFGYMVPNPDFKDIIERAWPGGDYTKVQPMGPSPVIIHKDQFASFVSDFNDTSVALKLDPEADQKFGWVLEMWGYAITCAKNGIVHSIDEKFCTEAAHNTPDSTLVNFPLGSKIMHFTYGIEYFHDATPCPPWNIGHWSLDKRHYGEYYPPKVLEPPPEGANRAAVWLHEAWQEAITNTPSWPDSPELGTWGWRREHVKEEFAHMPAAMVERAKALTGSRWSWIEAGDPSTSLPVSGELVLEEERGLLTRGKGQPLSGKWGWLPSPGCMEACWFFDVQNTWDFGRYTIRFSGDGKSFKGRDTRVLAVDQLRKEGLEVPEIQGTLIE